MVGRQDPPDYGMLRCPSCQGRSFERVFGTWSLTRIDTGEEGVPQFPVHLLRCATPRCHAVVLYTIDRELLYGPEAL